MLGTAGNLQKNILAKKLFNIILDSVVLRQTLLLSSEHRLPSVIPTYVIQLEKTINQSAYYDSTA